VLTVTPPVEVITVSRITALPSFHPEAGTTFGGLPVHAFLIRHPDGPILVDTGIGHDNTPIDEWYRPDTIDLRTELAGRCVDPDASLTIINTHFHFDHCGQNHAFPNATIVVQRSEVQAAKQPFYTVDEWAAVPLDQTAVVDGDREIVDGIHVMHTPGHTPGHQAVVIRTRTETIVIAGQCILRADEWNHTEPSEKNLHDAHHRAAAADSIARLRALRPTLVYLSHDHAICTAPTS
jgi:N-acyl homoserine lactone hydrolase